MYWKVNVSFNVGDRFAYNQNHRDNTGNFCLRKDKFVPILMNILKLFHQNHRLSVT